MQVAHGGYQADACALLVPLASSFSQKWKMRPKTAFVTMLSGFGVSGFWALTKFFEALGGEDRYLLGLEPIFPGLIITIALLLGDQYFKQLEIKNSPKAD